MGEEKRVEIDSSDEEDNINTVGDIPMEYYNNYDHIGYDTSGRPIIKPDTQTAIEAFLDKRDNCIKDPQTGQSIIISQEDCKLIRDLITGKSAIRKNEGDVNFDGEVMETPVTCVPPSKKTFIPPKDEQIKVSKLVHAIKMGFKPMPKPESDDNDDEIHEYSVWDEDCFDKPQKVFKHVTDENLQWLDKSVLNNKTKYQMNRKVINMPNECFYSNEIALHPAPEFLLSDEEIKKRKKKFYSRDYNPFRHKNEMPNIPGNTYDLDQYLVQFEKQERDLLYGQRYVKKQVNTTSEQMLKNCNPVVAKDVKPYPNTLETLLNTEEIVVDIAVNKTYVAVISYDYLKIYEGTSVKRKYPVTMLNREDVTLRNPLLHWLPNSYLLAVVVDNVLRIINPCLDILRSPELETKMEKWYSNRSNSNVGKDEDEPQSKKLKSSISWNLVKCNDESHYTEQLSYLEVIHNECIIDIDWNNLGHFVTISGNNRGTSSKGELFIHDLSNCNSFLFGKGHEFHISRFSPVQSLKLYVLVSDTNSKNNMSINVIDMKEKKKVMTAEVLGSACCMELSPIEADIMAVGSFEGKLYLYNLELSARPFKVLDVKQSAIRSISFSSEYRLFNICTANGSVVVFHISPADDDADPDSLDREHYVKCVHRFRHLEKEGELYRSKFMHDKCAIVTGGSSGMLYYLKSTH